MLTFAFIGFMVAAFAYAFFAQRTISALRKLAMYDVLMIEALYHVSESALAANRVLYDELVEIDPEKAKLYDVQYAMRPQDALQKVNDAVVKQSKGTSSTEND
jgi:hypothetical protein